MLLLDVAYHHSTNPIFTDPDLGQQRLTILFYGSIVGLVALFILYIYYRIAKFIARRGLKFIGKSFYSGEMEAMDDNSTDFQKSEEYKNARTEYYRKFK